MLYCCSCSSALQQIVLVVLSGPWHKLDAALCVLYTVRKNERQKQGKKQAEHHLNKMDSCGVCMLQEC